MYKIGDFSRLGQVSTRMLRHYDQLGLLRPSQVDKFTSYRYYTIDQLSRLHRIVALKDLGFSLEQVAELLGPEGKARPLSAERMRGMLELRQAELAQELAAKRLQLAQVEARLAQIEREGQPSPYEVAIKRLEPLPVAGIRQMVPDIREMGYVCASLYGSLYRGLAKAGITPRAPEVTIYHTEEYVEQDLDTEIAVAVDPAASLGQEVIKTHTLPAVDQAVCLLYQGPFSQLTEPILSLLDHVGRLGQVPAGPLRELHLSGPAHDEHGRDDPSPVIELQLPVRA
jgi:DNA-binding transcriptional MerR regulator